MTDATPASLDLQFNVSSRIHFALQQNDVPIVSLLRVQNRTDLPLRDLEVRVVAEPAFALDWSARIAQMASRSTCVIDGVDLQLSAELLDQLTERVRGRLSAVISREGQVIARCDAPVELLPRDEWPGLSSLPELLAAFVLPNHPVTEKVLRSAAKILGEWTGDPSLSGYQTKDPKRVYITVAAVYAAIQDLSLIYANPPASFEHEGQRVRLPDQILASRMATCLDISLLTAACLEQAGLNAIVVIVQGHAFNGIWLNDECFSEPAVDDGLRLRKRVDLQEITILDATCATAPTRLPFERATVEALHRLEDVGAFLFAIDLCRARKGGIRPLPVLAGRHADAATSAPQSESVSRPTVPALAPDPGLDTSRNESGSETPATRLDRWRRRLLDLSLRNRLLNFRDTKKTLPLLCPDLGVFEDMLAGGTTFKVLSRPGDLGKDDPRDVSAHRRRTGQEALVELLREELKSRRIRSDTTQEELDRRMLEIYRAARLGLEEGGASALYLAIGFLSWFETKESQQQRLAPILLLPLELHRQSVREGFSVQLADDEPRINVTLLEMLKQDHGIAIPGLDPLPEDDAGLDVKAVFDKMRRAIRDIDRWDVLLEAKIGLFSFTKFLMWRDLSERADQLMQNPVVEHLVNRPNLPYEPGAIFPKPETLDKERAPNSTFCPLPADSSQLAAIFAASEGRSFVLEGPPGTGKSQTIANLIAHCLTEGKTVLFISEKMAALKVVHRRLVGVGIGRYCLELHSDKANKRELIAQLQEAVQRLQSHEEDQWEGAANNLAQLRTDLNSYVHELHRKRKSGETVFQASSRLIGLREVPRVDLRWSEPDAPDAKTLAGLRDLAERLATAAAACGEVQGHALQGVHKTDWTPGWHDDVHHAIESLSETTDALTGRATKCSKRLGLGEIGWSLRQLDLMHDIMRQLTASPAPPTALIVRPDWEQIQDQLSNWIQQGQTRDRLRAEIREQFRDSITSLDLEDLRARNERAATAWWPASWWRRRPVRAALKAVAHDGMVPATQEITPTLDRALALREEQRKLDAVADDARSLLGRYWNNAEAEWDGIEKIRDWARGLRQLAVRAGEENPERVTGLREKWAVLAVDGGDPLRPGPSIGNEFAAYGATLDAFKAARSSVIALLQLDADGLWSGEDASDALGRIGRSCSRWLEGLIGLRDWCTWCRFRMEAAQNNLLPLVEAYERGTFKNRELPKVFERSYTQWWHSAVTDREPALSQFFSPEHERKIGKFRDVDERYMQLTRRLIAARLADRVPTGGSAVLPNSEMGIVMREVAKKRRHMPIRQLLQRIPNLLPRLKPCLLMSPMSVAQYMDAKYPPFDIVVFDEASQIPVWDAVGAIARGHQAVIVGDPKQLPPTNFFQRSDDDEDETEEDAVDDLESILDDCIGAQIPSQSLEWHYRSRHESLIAFSNYHYYGNRLLTFPSPAMSGLGVSWHQVPSGIYDKGKTRTNRAEAEAVVGEILRRLCDPALSVYSIGVVTFSVAQQSLIEDLLDARRRENPALDPYFAEGREEPVFVKNLENVQGDERDVILFSICYGPDAAGRISMNFGPMNRDGGERRLNVAITRARREVLVFSTLKADQIDLSRTRARGARDLKNFLEYAERGPAAIAEARQPDPDADFESPFEEAVFDALVARGWEVHKQVGCARYRIDLAVVDPAAVGRYLLGVECDGANYHSAKSARDRDKLREGVLRDLGWKLHRIWSPDWWTDAAREMQKLERALMRAQEEIERDVPPEVPAKDSASPPSPVRELIASAPTTETPVPAPAPEATVSELQYYRPITCSYAGGRENFYEYSAVPAIRERLIYVVRLEGPISLTLAARRVIAAWGYERVGPRALARIRSLARHPELRLEVTDAGEFLWPAGVAPDGYDRFRVPDSEGIGTREAEDIPPEEIGNAAIYLLERHMGAPLAELVRETARLFGFHRVGHVVDDRIRHGIERLVDKGVARKDGETISLST